MGTRPEATVPLGRTRARVLEALVAHAEPLGVTDLAEELGLHANTVRFHLDALVEAGLASRAADTAHTPGRPRLLFAATSDSAEAGQRSYRMLAEILAGHLALHSRQPGKEAADAGRVWGKYLARRPAPFTKVTAEDATRQLVDELDDMGFAPTLGGTERRPTILLNHCPFRELAMTQKEVVCSVHLGLAQGLLEESGAPITAEALTPFVTPTQCSIELRTRRGGVMKGAGRRT